MSGRSLIINSPDVPAEAIPVIIKNLEAVVVNVGASVEISNDVGNPLPVAGPLTNSELRAVPVPVTGPLTDAQLRAAPVVVVVGQITSMIATIANAASVSNDIDLGTTRLGRIAMPAAWTAADLTIQTSFDGVTWNSLYDKDGTEYTVKVAASRSVLMPLSDMLSVRYLRLRSGTSALPVVQGASRSILLVLVP